MRLSKTNPVRHYPSIMKTTCLLLAGMFFLTVGCATSQPARDNAVPPQATASLSSDLLILSAVYESGSDVADVTDRVNDLLHQPGVEFFTRPEWLHADPKPGWNKALVIVYEYKGRRHLFVAGEGDRVTAGLLIKQTDK
jgi:hypothetical protein